MRRKTLFTAWQEWHGEDTNQKWMNYNEYSTGFYRGEKEEENSENIDISENIEGDLKWEGNHSVILYNQEEQC